jgi:hypothetical protein
MYKITIAIFYVIYVPKKLRDTEEFCNNNMEHSH